MVKLKGFSTVEALISSMLIMITFAIVVMVFEQVISSNKSMRQFDAETRIMEMANKQLETTQFDTKYSVKVLSNEHPTYTDITVITYVANDGDGNEIARFVVNKKKVNEN